MKSEPELRVSFAGPDEFARAYWGNAGNGGLHLTDQAAYRVGQRVRLQLTLAWCDAHEELAATVLQRLDTHHGGNALAVAFAPSDTLRSVLAEVWASVHNNDNRQPRWPARAGFFCRCIRHTGEAMDAEILNVSAGGVGFRAAETIVHRLRPGTPLVLEEERIRLPLVVRWHLGVYFGAEFDAHPHALATVNRFLATVA